LDPLQEKVEPIVIKIDAANMNIEHIGLEGGELLQNPVTTQLVKNMVESSN
jgi:hypothetical protein